VRDWTLEGTLISLYAQDVGVPDLGSFLTLQLERLRNGSFSKGIVAQFLAHCPMDYSEK
jgi:hypothetical protein